jgi:hypothetical protein
MGEIRDAYEAFVGKPEGKGPLQDLRVHVTIILNWIVGKYNRKA